MDLHRLTKTDGPWLHCVIAAPADLSNQIRALEQKSTKRLAARVVRGRRATTKAALLDECAAALQFPLYFGENWDALHDCLGDLDWLNVEALVLIIADTSHLLARASAEEFQQFFRILEEAAKHWRQPGGSTKGRPYHVVLHAAPGEETALLSRCKSAALHPDLMA
jgi:hypothetical protein